VGFQAHQAGCAWRQWNKSLCVGSGAFLTTREGITTGGKDSNDSLISPAYLYYYNNGLQFRYLPLFAVIYLSVFCHLSSIQYLQIICNFDCHHLRQLAIDMAGKFR
jgi:hypothetical protein